MNGRIRFTKITIAVLLMVILALSAGCQNPKQENSLPDFEPGTLTITGNGVEHPIKYKAEELKSLQEALASECYSNVNNVGTKNYCVGKGIQFSYLLKKAGIRDTAQTITIMGSDGYTAVFTREQLEEQRFYFPGLMEGSEEEAQEVPIILAWEYQEGTSDLSKAKSDGLCLLIGQTGLNDVVVPAYVKDVVLIEASTSEPGQWETVCASPAPGKVEEETDIVLSHPEQDYVKMYYTMDGSTPDAKSFLYNPSTSYFKPEMNRPIAIDQDVIIKAIAIGFGKRNSPVAVFEYDVQE